MNHQVPEWGIGSTMVCLTAQSVTKWNGCVQEHQATKARNIQDGPSELPYMVSILGQLQYWLREGDLTSIVRGEMKSEALEEILFLFTSLTKYFILKIVPAHNF
jgi:hypothetical protein